MLSWNQKKRETHQEGKRKMSIYGYTYNNGITSGVVFIEKTGSTWTAQVTNGYNDTIRCGGYKTRKAAKADIERATGTTLKTMR